MQPNPLKALIVLALMLLALPAPAPTTNSPSVTLAWDQSTSQSVTGYGVYLGVSSRLYTNTVFRAGLTNTTCTISNLQRGVTYYFAATAFTGTLESDYSTEVTYSTTPLPPVPQNTTIKEVAP